MVQGVEVHVTQRDDEDYICLTDMIKAFNDGDTLIKSWFRNKNTIEFIGVWESLNNPNFNWVEFDLIKSESGLNRFTMSAKQWTQRTNGIGIIAKTGRYGSGTYAHRDIAFEFGSWLDPSFKLYLIKEFQRLKEQEIKSGKLEWNIRRSLTKTNYRIQTDAIKTYLIPPQISKVQEGYIYASEADLLNVALFGKTSKEWKSSNTDKEGSIRVHTHYEILLRNVLGIKPGILSRRAFWLLVRAWMRQSPYFAALVIPTQYIEDIC